MSAAMRRYIRSSFPRLSASLFLSVAPRSLSYLAPLPFPSSVSSSSSSSPARWEKLGIPGERSGILITIARNHQLRSLVPSIADTRGDKRARRYYYYYDKIIVIITAIITTVILRRRGESIVATLHLRWPCRNVTRHRRKRFVEGTKTSEFSQMRYKFQSEISPKSQIDISCYVSWKYFPFLHQIWILDFKLKRKRYKNSRVSLSGKLSLIKWIYFSRLKIFLCEIIRFERSRL